MRILALDTAASACSAALWRDGRIEARRSAPMERGHAEALIGMVGEVVGESGFSGLDLVAVTVGPGAFTGLRIGLAAARGMALACGIGCFGVTTLEVVAHATGADERRRRSLLVALDTKRADVYAQAFGPDLDPLSPPRALPPAELAGLVPEGPALIAGDAADRAAGALAGAGFEVQLSTAPGVPDAAVVAAIAAARWRPGAAVATPAPLYLRPPDATVPRHGGRLRP